MLYDQGNAPFIAEPTAKRLVSVRLLPANAVVQMSGYDPPANRRPRLALQKRADGKLQQEPRIRAAR